MVLTHHLKEKGDFILKVTYGCALHSIPTPAQPGSRPFPSFPTHKFTFISHE
jgi:hypothetical protein